jgi:hypothetical protein
MARLPPDQLETEIPEIPGVQIAPLPSDRATLAPLMSLGIHDEDGARVVVAGFSLAKVRPAGPWRKGRPRKVAQLLSKAVELAH